MLNADLKEFEFTSGFDQLVLSAAIATPSGRPNGVVQLVHGLNEHKERYFPFMDYLAEEGFITVICDSRGHGKSVCAPEDLGFMYHNGCEGFVKDIAQTNEMIRKAYPDMPVFLLGFGLGASGALCFVRERSRDVNGVVLAGTPCYSAFSPIVRAIGSEAAKKPGSRFRSEKVYDAVDDVLGRFFEQPDNSWRCSDPAVVEAFNADPLCNFKLTMNCCEEALCLIRDAFSGGKRGETDPSLPMRFVSGKDDPVMLSEKKFFRMIKRWEKAGCESVSHRLFDGMRHEILNEKNCESVWKDIAKSLFSWIDRYNDARASAETEADNA